MPTSRLKLELPLAEAEQLLRPRTDILIETSPEAETDQRSAVYAQEAGPFKTYRREAKLTPNRDGSVTYSETTSFRTAIPFWGRAVDILMGTAVRDRRPHSPT